MAAIDRHLRDAPPGTYLLQREGNIVFTYRVTGEDHDDADVWLPAMPVPVPTSDRRHSLLDRWASGAIAALRRRTRVLDPAA